MLQTHRKVILQSGRRFLQSGMQEERNNLLIPFTSSQTLQQQRNKEKVEQHNTID